jgi:tetratricopeptide (TPR) repeat protein
MGNLSDALAGMDPAAAVDAGRAAIEHLRRTGSRIPLAVAITNLAEALLQMGDWDAAEAELTQAPDPDAHADIDQIRWKQAWLAALRGDARTAEAWLVEMPERRQASEDPQWKSGVSIVEALTAAARGRPPDALRHARAALAHTDALGISFETVRWSWPLAARCAYELDDTAAAVELLALLDSYQPGYLAPMLRAERDLVRARLAAGDGDGGAAAAFTAAIKSLRAQSTPYHLAHGLLDYVEYLLVSDDARAVGATGAAQAAIEEARDIAGRLRCQPLLDRAVALVPPNPATATPQDSPPVAR